MEQMILYSVDLITENYTMVRSFDDIPKTHACHFRFELARETDIPKSIVKYLKTSYTGAEKIRVDYTGSPDIGELVFDWLSAFGISVGRTNAKNNKFNAMKELNTRQWAGVLGRELIKMNEMDERTFYNMLNGLTLEEKNKLYLQAYKNLFNEDPKTDVERWGIFDG